MGILRFSYKIGKLIVVAMKNNKISMTNKKQ